MSILQITTKYSAEERVWQSFPAIVGNGLFYDGSSKAVLKGE